MHTVREVVLQPEQARLSGDSVVARDAHSTTNKLGRVNNFKNLKLLSGRPVEVMGVLHQIPRQAAAGDGRVAASMEHVETKMLEVVVEDEQCSEDVAQDTRCARVRRQGRLPGAESVKITNVPNADPMIDAWEDNMAELSTEFGEGIAATVQVTVLWVMLSTDLQDKSCGQLRGAKEPEAVVLFVALGSLCVSATLAETCVFFVCCVVSRFCVPNRCVSEMLPSTISACRWAGLSLASRPQELSRL